MHIQKNVPMQDIQTHHVFIAKLVKWFAFVMNSVVLFVNSVENLICDVSIYARVMKLLNAKNLRNHRMWNLVSHTIFRCPFRM